jgi:hypothetical protein
MNISAKSRLNKVVEDLSDLRVFFLGNSILDRSVMVEELERLETEVTSIIESEETTY